MTNIHLVTMGFVFVGFKGILLVCILMSGAIRVWYLGYAFFLATFYGGYQLFLQANYYFYSDNVKLNLKKNL